MKVLLLHNYLDEQALIAATLVRLGPTCPPTPVEDALRLLGVYTSYSYSAPGCCRTSRVLPPPIGRSHQPPRWPSCTAVRMPPL
ncbi:MAG: hypothetical protein WKH64_01655 [Chloroflexia bacterium]